VDLSKFAQATFAKNFEMRIFNRGPLYFSITGLQFHFSSATEIECSLYLKLWIMTSIFVPYCEQDAIPNPFGDIISCVKSQDGRRVVERREHFKHQR
jgi:hypothetical protein